MKQITAKDLEKNKSWGEVSIKDFVKLMKLQWLKSRF